MRDGRSVVNAAAERDGSGAPSAASLGNYAFDATRPAPRAIMYAYPWDFDDHGVEDSLDTLQGCGFDAVQLSFTYHIATYLTPRNPKRRVRFGEQGMLQFDPGVIAAGDWPFAPPVSADVAGTDYITRLLRAIASRDLRTIAWVVFLYSHTLARARPDLAVENAFGDRHGAQLCPANPDVRAYARALTQGVTSHGPLWGMVAESLSYLPYDYGFLNLKAAIAPATVTSILLSLCFCPHCRRAGLDDGIDVDRLREAVRNTIDGDLARLPDGPLEPVVSEEGLEHAFDGALAALLATRERVASSLQQAVLSSARAAGLRAGTTAAEGQDPRIHGVRNEAVRPFRDEYRFEVFPEKSEADIGQQVRVARERAGLDLPLYALAQLSYFPTERSFRRALDAAYVAGIRHFRIYEFGLLTERQLDWLRRTKELWTDDDPGTREP